MTKVLVTLALIFTTAYGQVENAAPDLEGVWQSDEDRTYAYNLERSQKLDKTRKFLHDLGGHEVLEFSGEKLHSYMPDLDVAIEGKSFHMAGWDETHAYRILFRNADTVAFETTG